MPHDEHPDRPQPWWPAAAVLALALAFHAWAAAGGWKNGNLPGNEFRQTQTALSAMFIQRDGDFSPAYPTPVLGKPWSVPMEFPLYQWTVVKVSDWTGLPLLQAGRAVSLACFYGALAALFPLLGRLGLAAGPRLVVMGFVLTCPLHIFFARAFLIETMALMFSLWFLVAFGRMITAPCWRCLAGAAGFGALAGLVKVTTFSVYLLVAAVWTLSELRRQFAAAGGAGAVRRGAWALGAVVLPVGATLAWTRFADGVKRQNPLADFLVSGNLTNFNFGNVQNRFSAETLGAHWRHLIENMAGPVLLAAAALLLATVSRRWWPQVALCLACYLVPLAVFPTLYAWHDYYSMANAVLLLAGLGVTVAGALSLRLRWLPWALLLLLHLSQAWVYRTRYYEWQRVVSPGGSEMTKAVGLMTEPEEVIVVSGYDWDSSVSFYAGRRALMLRHGTERDRAYFEAAFRVQAGLPVTVFVVRDVEKQDVALLQAAVRRFGLDPRPLFRWQDITVFGRADLRARMTGALREEKKSIELRLDESTRELEPGQTGRRVRTADRFRRERAMFATFSPEPESFYSQYGARPAEEGGRSGLFAHPLTQLWFEVAPGRRTVEAGCLVQAAAYGGPVGDRTDGVEFILETEQPDGTRTRLASLLLQPAQRAADAGWHTLRWQGEVAAGSSLVLSSGPGPAGSFARDWAIIGPVKID